MTLQKIMEIIENGDICDGDKEGMATRSFVLIDENPMCTRRPEEKYHFNKSDFSYDWKIVNRLQGK